MQRLSLLILVALALPCWCLMSCGDEVLPETTPEDVPPSATMDARVAVDAVQEPPEDVAGPEDTEGPPEDAAAPPEDVAPETTPPPTDAAEDTGSDAPIGPTFDPDSVTIDEARFTLGVQAADATTVAVILATWSDSLTSLHAVAWRSDDLEIAWEGDVTTDKEGYARIEAEGLEPWTEYGYAFIQAEAESPVRSPSGRFLTAPAPDTMPPLVFGATSCINMPLFEGLSMSRAGEAKLDLFLLAGDTVYADGADDIGEYRDHWVETYEMEPMRDLRASTSVLATWDDHEVGNNWNPESTDAAKIEAARSAFFEFTSARVDPDHPERIWRSFMWGQTAEFFLLDCRGERKPSTKDTDEAQYLSPDQLAWLQVMLLSSEAVFKVVVNSVAFTKMPWTFPSAEDRWQGYEAQRELLLQTLENTDGVLFISGDFHFGAVMRIEAPPHPVEHIYEVLAGPSAQFPNPGVILIDNGFFESQIPFTTGTNNYTRFTADPWADPPQITVDFVAGDGDVFHTQALWF